MSLTFSQARDEIFSIVQAAWLPTTYKMVWPDKPDEKPTGRSPWARVTLQHSSGGQATLADGQGRSRWKRQGLIALQVFTPVGGGLAQGYSLAQLLANSLEGASTPGGVWFQSTRINEIGPSGDWFQINVTADFIYDEIK